MRLGDRVRTERHQQFVGRAAELSLFWSALTAEQLPFNIFYIFGPGGVGKTSLLHEFAYICSENGIPVVFLDGRNIEPSPESFLTALRMALGLREQEPVLDILASQTGRHVLLIDTLEVLLPLEPWFIKVFVPQLSINTLLVLAGRRPPPMSWRADPGWQTVMRVIPLRNLTPDEGRLFLSKRNIPAEKHQPILEFTHGHPLALALMADVLGQSPERRVRPEAAQDAIRFLLEQFLEGISDTAQRAALEACSIALVTTEGLLAALLAVEDAHDLFEWLRGLSFIESGPLGLFPHDLAREVLLADLRWRNRDRYIELHRRARTYYAGLLSKVPPHEQQRVLIDYIFLHRDNPVVQPYFFWLQGTRSIPEATSYAVPALMEMTDTMQESDRDTLVLMVAQHEGEESASIAEHWLTRQPEGVLVFRDAEQTPAGFLAVLKLEKAEASDIERDPATAAAWRYLQQQAPLRPGEQALYFRFWMARTTYQALSGLQSLIFVNVVRHYLTTPKLAFTFFPCADPDFWAPVFAYADLTRIPEADFEVGGRRYGVYGHDWRTVPPVAWLELLAQRETALTAPPSVPPTASVPLIVLSQSDFALAVRHALRNFHRPEALRTNPLLRSRLVLDRAGGHADEGTRIATLQALLQEAAEALRRSPRHERWYRALHHSYLRPALSQEQAAEAMDVPFSTFRRYLVQGLKELTDFLWRQEISA